MNCASSQSCLGLYEPCKSGLVEGSSCGHYATCIDLDGEVKHSERPASSSNVANVGSTSDNAGNSGQLYPSLPQPDYPSYPQGGYNPNPNPQGGPPNPQNPQGGYYPSNPQGNPNYPPASGNKKDSSDSDSGFSSLLNNFLGGNNRGSSGGNSGPDLGTLLSILGRSGSGGNSSPASGSGSGGLDFSSLFSAFTGAGGRGSSQNNRNDFDNRNPTSQSAGPNPQNPNGAQDSGSSLLQSLGSLASSPLVQQLLLTAAQSRGNENDAQQRRSFGGLFSENTSKTTQTVPGSGSKGYPTQAPYTPYN